MIHKAIVLFRIKNFQKSKGGISSKISSNFVNLIKHKYWIITPCAPNSLTRTSAWA